MMHLFLLHGNLGSPRDWSVCRRFREDRGVACHPIDLWELLKNGADSLDSAGNAIAALAPAGETCALVGYSLGGRLALHAAAAHPDLWQALVLLSAHPGLTDEAACVQRLEDDLQWADKCRQDSPATFLAAWNARETLSGSGIGPAPTYDPHLAALAFDRWSLGRQRNFAPWLRTCPLPLLWLTGERDARFTALAASCRPDASLILPGAGHRLLQEAPDETAHHILQFLRSLPCRSSR